MTAALINQLHEVGSTCRELAAWCRCDDDRREHCGACILSGPEICEAQIIKALARRHFDQVTK